MMKLNKTIIALLLGSLLVPAINNEVQSKAKNVIDTKAKKMDIKKDFNALLNYQFSTIHPHHKLYFPIISTSILVSLAYLGRAY